MGLNRRARVTRVCVCVSVSAYSMQSSTVGCSWQMISRLSRKGEEMTGCLDSSLVWPAYCCFRNRIYT